MRRLMILDLMIDHDLAVDLSAEDKIKSSADITWVDKNKLIPRKEESFDKFGKLFKYSTGKCRRSTTIN